MIQILFAILAGILTIGAPCILPLLPILLGTSVGQNSKTRPLYIVAGFILVFSIFGILLSYLTTHLGIEPNTLRNIAILLLAIFGMLMIWPKPFELLTVKINGMVNKANQIGQSRSGNFGGFLLGMMLGVIWTPCAGPILGAILTLIATQGNTFRSVMLLLAYAIGAAVPMLIIAYGSQYVTTKVRWIAQYSIRLQQFFGVLIILLAVAMYFQYDTLIQNKLTQYFPTTAGLEEKLTQTNTKSVADLSDTKKIEFQNFGQAPEFTGISHWINSDPLTIKNLRGKVVLIDFWTYSCINCIRTLPYVTKWYDTYKDQGFVVIGVHTPEFPFEKVTENVQTAAKRLGINYPIAQDNDYGTWLAYDNHYWPAEYLIDKSGKIVLTHFGEGNYDHMENAIRLQLGLDMDPNAATSNPSGKVYSPEMYFGTARLEYLETSQTQIIQKTSIDKHNFVFPDNLKLNQFALEGYWQESPEQMTCLNPNCKIRLKFSSGKVFMVAASDKPVTLNITVDGKPQKSVTVQMSDLYTLFDSEEYTNHEIEITIPDAGFEAFTFTFG